MTEYDYLEKSLRYHKNPANKIEIVQPQQQITAYKSLRGERFT